MEQQSYKQREIDAIRKTQDEILRRVRNWPVFESDKSQIAVGLEFWIDSAVEKLETVSWADSEPPLPLDEFVSKEIKKQQRKELEKEIEMLEKQNA